LNTTSAVDWHAHSLHHIIYGYLFWNKCEIVDTYDCMFRVCDSPVPWGWLLMGIDTSVLAWKYGYEFNCQEKLNFINSFQNMHVGLYSSCIALSFYGFGSISPLFLGSLESQYFGFPTFSAWGSLKRHNLSKCASGAWKLAWYEF
jgi:hypothetical protein